MPKLEPYTLTPYCYSTLRAIALAVERGFVSDPGTSDLYDEQPIHIDGFTLGLWRKARQVLAVVDNLDENTDFTLFKKNT